MKRISVIIPTYNSGAFLEECVSSVINNSADVNIELIVVDDCSDQEESREVLSRIRKQYEMLFIQHNKNSGVQIARNNGLEAATGEFVMCLDSDDTLLNIDGKLSYLCKAAQILESDADVAFVHTMSCMFGDFSGLTISAYPLHEDLIVRKHHVPTPIVFRKKEINFGLRHDDKVLKWQDWAFGISLIGERWRRGEKSKIGFVAGPGHGYRIHTAYPRISRGLISEVDATRSVVETYRDFFVAKLPACANDTEALLEYVIANKPDRLQDLMYMAAFDLAQASTVASQRKFALKSGISEDLGIP